MATQEQLDQDGTVASGVKFYAQFESKPARELWLPIEPGVRWSFEQFQAALFEELDAAESTDEPNRILTKPLRTGTLRILNKTRGVEVPECDDVAPYIQQGDELAVFSRSTAGHDALELLSLLEILGRFGIGAAR